MKFLIGVTVLLMLLQNVACQTVVTVYENTNYGGAYVDCGDIDPWDYIYFTDFNDETTSFRIHQGSCVEMHMHDPPYYGSNNDWFWTDDLDFPNVGSEYNDRISSVKSCGRYTKTIQCPNGTFVKKIQWDNSNMMTNGVELYCYLPRSLEAGASFRTHGSGALNGKTECTGVNGIRYTRDGRRLAHTSMQPLCNEGNPGGDTRICDKKQAVSGMQVDIENRSGYIKSSTLYCSDIGDIESDCKALDKHNDLFTCENYNGVGPIKCGWEKTIGYGYRSSLSQEEWEERSFHEEFGFEIGTAGFGLSANFKVNLGSSETTGYKWSETQESTFNEEVKISVEVEAPPGCSTKVVEILGECAFMEVRPNYFQRQDNCTGVGFKTDEHIPQGFDVKQVFVSKIPAKVMEFLKASKHNEEKFI